MRLDLTLAQISAIRTAYADQLDEDERLMLDTLEGETDALAIVRRLLNGIERDEGDKAALIEQMEARKVRKDRCDQRIAAQRDAIAAIMQTAGLDRLPLPEATISLREVPAKLAIGDKSAVPDEFCVPKLTPSMDKIKAAFSLENGNLPNWLGVEPSRPSITVRRK